MENYLITGGAGFIGSNLANYLASENTVIVIDDLSMGKQENLINSNNIKFIKGSVTNHHLMEDILSSNQFDYIFHLAAIASVADSVARPVETHQINFESVLSLLELVKKTQPNLKKLVFSSSAAVYGDEPSLPKIENSAIKPLTPYAIDKYAAERYVNVYNHLYDVPTSAVRFFNIYGPNQNPSSPYSGVISILIDNYRDLLKKRNISFTLYGDGEQSRDFVYIEDAIQALLLVAKSSHSKGEVYNVGTGKAITLNELIFTIDKILGVKLPVVFMEERSGDIKHSLSNTEKLTLLGYKPSFTVEKGIASYLSKLKLK